MIDEMVTPTGGRVWDRGETGTPRSKNAADRINRQVCRSLWLGSALSWNAAR